MILTLRRVAAMATYTQGYLFMNHKFWCDTLENRVRQKYGSRCKTKKAALPPGLYTISLVRRHAGPKVPMIQLDKKRYVRFKAGTAPHRLGHHILVGHNTRTGWISQEPLLLKNLLFRIEQALLRQEPVRLIIQ